MPRSSRVTTIADVAVLAGVSPTTVSRVLNGSDNVAAELEGRVRDAVEHLGYRPNGAARALRQRVTNVWFAIIADVENPFFTAVMRAAEDEAVAAGHQMVLCNSDEDLEKESAYIDVAIAERAGGVIIAVASTAQSDLDRLVSSGIPIVAIDRRPARGDVDAVVVDNRLGGAMATEHLLDAGATRLACITGPSRLPTAEDRLEGFRSTVEARLGRLDPNAIRRADFRVNGGYAAATSLLTGLNRYRPDALFVTNNLMTLGALRAIRDAGLRVPDDILLVGFDDALWAPLTQPPLTVVAQPTREIGATAARLLGTPRPDGQPRHVVLEPSLVVRASSRRP